VTRQVSNLVEIEFGDGETITGTPQHPIWSMERQDWIELGDLEIGEHLWTEDGPIEITDRRFLPTGESVYNIEVHGHHIYQVGDVGVLVHNAKLANYKKPRPKTDGRHNSPKSFRSKVPHGSKLLTQLTKAAHKALHKALNSHLKKIFGKTLIAGKKWWLKNTTWKKRYKALIDFYRTYKGGKYFDKFMKEVRDGIRKGQNPLGK
jgi:hypothetical protein